jgi:hypothetical protein
MQVYQSAGQDHDRGTNSQNPRRKRATGNLNHGRWGHVPVPSERQIEQRLKDLLSPVVYAELVYYRRLGLRNRLLTLPVMTAVGLALNWRGVPGVCIFCSKLYSPLSRHQRFETSPPSI